MSTALTEDESMSVILLQWYVVNPVNYNCIRNKKP